MTTRKKPSTMKWVMESQQSGKLAEHATENKTSSEKLDCSLLTDSVSKLQLSSSSPSAKMAQQNGWSQLPEELLQIISEKLDCFDTIHARSVCRPWRSIFPFPYELLRTSYSLPSFEKSPGKSIGLQVCTLEKFSMFLFRVRSPGLPCEYFVGATDHKISQRMI